MGYRGRYRTRKKLSGGIKRHYHAYKNWEVGDFVVGEYVSKVMDTYNPDDPKPCLILKVKECEFANPVCDREGNIIDDLVGKNLQLNPSGSITYSIFAKDENGEAKANVGDLIGIEYKGQMDAKEWRDQGKKGQPPHQFDIELIAEDEEEETNDLFI